VDWRRPELQRAVAFAIDGDRHVHHLDVLRCAHRTVGVRRNERESEHAAIVGGGLPIEADDG